MKKSLALISILSLGVCNATVTYVPPNLVNTTLNVVLSGGGVIIEAGGSITNTTQVGVELNPGGGGISNQFVVNSGTILTTGASAFGIFNNIGTNAVMTNAGSLSTSGASAFGIFNNTSTNAVMMNAGSLSTNGASAFGIFNNASTNAAMMNSGSLSTIGATAHGIFNNASTNTEITNSGSISTGGQNALGIENFNSNNVVITNIGKISSLAADGIRDDTGTSVLIVNSGVVYGGANAIKIVTPGNSPTLSLLLGSNLQGPVHVDTFPLNLVVQTGLNLSLTLDGASTTFGNLNIKAPFVVQEDPAIAVIDPTGLAMQSDMTADFGDALLQGIYLPRECSSCGIWTEAIGSYRKRNQQSQTLAYTDWLAGILLGYDAYVAGQAVTIFGGCTYGEEDILASAQEANIILGCGGLAYEGCFCNTFVGLSAVGAYVRWNNTRTVMNNLAPGGMDQGKAHINGGFVAADWTLGRGLPSLFCSPFFSFNLRYAELFLGSYTETGSLTNLTIHDRNVGLITTRLEAAFWRTACRGFLEPFIGVYGRYQVAGTKVKGVLLEQSIYFDQEGPLNLVAGLIGFRANQSLGCLRSFFDVEASFDNAGSNRILGELGLKF